MEKQCEFCGVLIEGLVRVTKKYCSDNCKQLAFYRRQGMNWGKPDLAGIIPSTHELPFNVKPDFTLSDEQETDAEIVQPVSIQQPFTQEKLPETEVIVKLESEKQDSVKPQPVHKYKWVNSRLLGAIERYRDLSDEEYKFRNPRKYFTPDAVETLGWISVRFRCLLENIIRLSNYKCIDRDTLLAISRAFTDLCVSSNFGSLSHCYPFASLINDLQYRFKVLAEELQGEEIAFRLSLSRKAELMAVRFMIGNFVPKISFSQLKFGDGFREEVEAEFKNREQELGEK